MVVTEVTMAKACPKGANLAETMIGPKKKVMTSTGEAWVGDEIGVYMTGLPINDGMARPVLAPVDLAAGDLVLVERGENMPYKVLRGDKEVWSNKVIADNLAAGEKERQAKRGFYAAQR